MNLKSIVYGALDAITVWKGVPRRIDGCTIRFPARWSRYYEADYEPETFRFLKENLQTGDTFFDIGAHIGLFSVVSSRLVGMAGKVYSFEPTPFTNQVLHDVIRLNACQSNVEIRPEAIAEAPGNALFYDTGTEVSNANSLVETSRSKQSIEIPVNSIDNFVAERELAVNCIKIDVEGAEYDLLKGAKNVLTNQRPIARLGLHPESMSANGHSLAMIWDILKEYRYEVEYHGAKIGEQEFCSQPTLFDVNLFPAG